MSYVVTGLGFGDEGKGMTVEALCRRDNIKVVVRHNGGGQAAHNVCQKDGRHHTFSQFGSNSFMDGAITILSKYMIVNPSSFLVEQEVLAAKTNLPQVFIDERSLVTTPFHVQLNRLREAARGVAKHGTTGMGISETVLDSLAYPKEVIRMEDLLSFSTIVKKLHECRDRLMVEAERFGGKPNFDRIDITKVVQRFWDFSNNVTIGSKGIQKIMAKGPVVFEGAQGVLLDQDFGFHPHTTWSKTTPHNAWEICKEFGIEAPKVVGVTRVYATRHGEGPFPTERYDLDFPEIHNAGDGFAGQFRVGHLDIGLLNYANQCCGGIDYLAVNHIDCKPDFYFDSTMSRPLTVPSNVHKQEGLCGQMWKVLPLSEAKQFPENFPEFIAQQLMTKLLVTGGGLTYEDRAFRY